MPSQDINWPVLSCSKWYATRRRRLSSSSYIENFIQFGHNLVYIRDTSNKIFRFRFWQWRILINYINIAVWKITVLFNSICNIVIIAHSYECNFIVIKKRWFICYIINIFSYSYQWALNKWQVSDLLYTNGIFIGIISKITLILMNDKNVLACSIRTRRSYQSCFQVIQIREIKIHVGILKFIENIPHSRLIIYFWGDITKKM